MYISVENDEGDKHEKGNRVSWCGRMDLRECAEQLARTIYDTESSLNEGDVVQDWKIANIVSVYT